MDTNIPKLDIHNESRREKFAKAANKHDTESCSDLSLKSLACQSIHPSSRVESCQKQITEYKECVAAQIERKKALRAARAAGNTVSLLSLFFFFVLISLPFTEGGPSASASASAALERARKGPVFEGNELKRNALHHACIEGSNPNSISHLLTSTNDHLMKEKDNFGYTPFFYAVTEGHLPLVIALFEAGADIHAVDKWHETPLHKAAARGQVDVAGFLIERGANVNALDKNGRGPLIMASGEGHVEIVQLLLTSGADPLKKASYKSTPLSVAKTDEVKAVIKAEIERREGVRNAEQASLRAQTVISDVGKPSENCDVTGRARHEDYNWENPSDEERKLAEERSNVLLEKNPPSLTYKVLKGDDGQYSLDNGGKGGSSTNNGVEVKSISEGGYETDPEEEDWENDL
jgi:ankyrin repeat protein